MYDPDIQAKIRAGGWMVTLGILLMVAGLFGTCLSVGSRTSRRGYYDEGAQAAESFEAGENPFLLIAFAGGIALITVGQVKKSNARRVGEERFRRENFMTTKVVPDPDAPGGPFRGSLKEVEELDPMMAAVEAEQRARDRAKGNNGLIAGGTIIVLTLVIMFASILTAAPHELLNRFLMSFGLGVFPFGLGLFFAIRGLLLRSK